MKGLGFILIGCQVLAYMSGNSKNMGNESIAYLLGYNAMGIIGVILLLIAITKKTQIRKNEKFFSFIHFCRIISVL
jgi:hypothetical protein